MGLGSFSRLSAGKGRLLPCDNVTSHMDRVLQSQVGGMDVSGDSTRIKPRDKVDLE